MAKRIKSAFQQITSAVKLDQPGAGKNFGVVLDEDQKIALEAIAKDLGITRHATMKLAIRKFIADWSAGWRPVKTTRTVTRYDLDDSDGNG